MNPSGQWRNGVTQHPQGTNNSRLCHQLQKSWLQSTGMIKVLVLCTSSFWEHLTLTTILKQWQVWMFTFVMFVLQEECLKCCSSLKTLGHSHVCIPQRPSQILDEQCCHLYPTVMTLHHHIVMFGRILLFQWQGSEECLAPVAVEDGQQLSLGKNNWSCSKVQEVYSQRLRPHLKITVP